MKKLLSAILAATMLLTMTVFPTVAAEEDPVVSRFAVVSDTHVTSKTETTDRLAKVFETAYAYAEGQGGTIDAFVFNGDSVDGSATAGINEEQWRLFFSGVKAGIKGNSKFLLTLARTHDIYESKGTTLQVSAEELNALIGEHLGTDGSIIPTAEWGYDPHLTVVNGAAIITLSNDMTNTNNSDNHYRNSEEWLKTQLDALVEENPERPIFVVYHYPEVGGLGWSQRWGQNGLRDTLNNYPQVITFNAHVHWDPRLTDSIAQDRFTEIYDGAVRYISYPDGTSASVSNYDLSNYSVVEVTASGAVTVKYIDTLTGELLKEANGSGETLEYSIPKAWDRSTYLYTGEKKHQQKKASFAANASITLQNGKTLQFDRAESEAPVLYYTVTVSDGETATTQNIASQFYLDTLPEHYSVDLELEADKTYTVTVTATDGLYRESANTLTLRGKVNDPNQPLVGNSTAITEKAYGENGEKGAVDYPDFKTYATNPDAATVTDWGISDMEDLKAWSDFSKSNTCKGLTFHLENDIDMKDQSFNMIGSIYSPFSGTFNGHLHTVSNLLIDDYSSMGTGFFVYLKNAVVTDFGIESGLVRGDISNRVYENTGKSFTDAIGVGAIAGRADGTRLTHVWNKADVTYHHLHTLAESNYAGLVGRAHAACTFIGCYNTGDVHGLNRASGFTNWAQSKTSAARLINCFNLGKITTEEEAATESLIRYGSATTYNDYCLYNTYYLENSASFPVSTSGVSADVHLYSVGAKAPAPLTAEQANEDLAALLNAERESTPYIDTAVWVQGEDGHPVISSLDDSITAKVASISTYSADPNKPIYTVGTADELNTLAALSKTTDFADKTILLLEDIDMSAVTDFAMIGNSTYKFAGTFDGQGHTVSGLTMALASYTGMFVYTDGATLKNFTLSGAKMSGSESAGRFALLVARSLSTTIDNVHIINSTMELSYTSSVYRSSFFVGEFNGGTNTVTNCTSVGNSVTSKGIQGFGCFVGYNSQESTVTTIEHCAAINNTLNIRFNCGILAGYVYDGTLIIDDCFTYGNSLTTQNTGNDSKKLGAAIGNTAGSIAATIKNTVLTDDNVLVGCTTVEPTVTNTYVVNGYTNDSSKPSVAGPTPATVITAAQIESGEIAHKMGWTMKDGKLAFANETDLATRKYTYQISGQEDIIRYTDHTGAVIGEAVQDPAKEDHLFCGWNITTDENGDQLWVAELRLLYDVNEDETVDTADAVTLLRYIDGHPLPVHPAVADINGDGMVKVFDVVRLLQILRDKEL